MTKQAVMEPAPAQVTEPAGEQAPAPEAAVPAKGARQAGDEALIAGELLVEEVSIDGMCGVY
jgi:mycofactocin precursor